MGDIDFKVIFAAENSNKFQKTRFGKEKSAEDVVTLGPTPQAILVECDREYRKGNRQDLYIITYYI